MSGNVFGIGEPRPEEKLGLVERDEEEIVEEPAEPAEPETTEEVPDDQTGPEGSPDEGSAPEEPTEQATEEPAGDAETQEETTAPEDGEVDPVRAWVESIPEGVQFAGKFTDPFEVEKAYNESQRSWYRAVESRKAAEQAAQEAFAERQQLEAIIGEAIPYFRQAAEREQQFHQFAAQYREQTGEYPPGYTGPLPPQPAVAEVDIEQVVERRLQQERAAYEAAREAQLYEQRLTETVSGFYSDHPEVSPRSVEDNRITETMQALNEAWAVRGIQVDETDRDTVEILYETSQRPALQRVLELRPEYFTSEDGMELARRDALVLEGRAPAATQETRQVPASKVGAKTGAKKPFAESASGTGPAPEEPATEWDAIKQSVRAGRGRGTSVFQFE